MKKRWPTRSKKETTLGSAVRFAVLHPGHNEIYSANHQVIGEAFNCRDEGYVPNIGIVVVATLNDEILGVVNRDGSFIRKQPSNLPKTIWCGSPHPFFNPAI